MNEINILLVTVKEWLFAKDMSKIPLSANEDRKKKGK